MNKLKYGDLKYAYMCSSCKKPAFFLFEMHKAGDQLFAQDVLTISFEHPKSGDIVTCGNCGLKNQYLTPKAILPFTL